MATLRHDRRTGNWQIRLYWNGGQQERSCNTKKRSKALRTLAVVEDTIELLKSGRLTMPDDVEPISWIVSGGKVQKKPGTNGRAKDNRFGKICDGYLEDQQQKQETTLCGERIHIGHLKKLLWSATAIDTIDLDTLKHYRRRRSGQSHHGKPISDATIKKELVTFRQIWMWAKQNGYVKSECPLIDDRGRWAIPFKKPNTREKFKTWAEIEREIGRGGLSDEQVRTLWEGLYLDHDQVSELLEYVAEHAAYEFIYPMFAFAAYTGARRSEILRSRIDDVDFDFDQTTIRERKRRKDRSETTRVVPLHPNLRSVMERWFATHPGGRFTIECPKQMPRKKARTDWTGVSRNQAQHHFESTLRNSKWSIVAGFHVLRHSFGSNLIRSDVSSDLVAKWMGHTTMVMRELYQHVFRQDGVGQISRLS